MAFSSGFHDLGVVVENDSAFGRVKQASMANALIRLGYDAIAYNVSVTAPLKSSDSCQLVLGQEEAAGKEEKKGKKGPLRDPTALRVTGWGDERPGKRRREGGEGGLIQQYTRLTVTVEDPAHVTALTDSAVNSYDILAVRPATEKVFETVCKTANVDIISLDLASRLPFFLKPALVTAALDRGIHFEIGYANSLRDSSSRRQFISNTQGLCRAGRGRGIILTSDASRELELRGPNDVLNLSLLFGVDAGAASRCLKQSSVAVLKHAEQRKRGSRLIVGAASAQDKPAYAVPRAVGAQGGGGGDFMALQPDSDEEEEDEEEGEEEGEEGGEEGAEGADGEGGEGEGSGDGE